MSACLKKILITAGPTREMLDPVRFLSNLSTGEMGYALARAAKKQGCKVTLISGPTVLEPPLGVRFIPTVSAAEMKKACDKYFPSHDILIMTAAVCDFTASRRHPQKIHRTQTKKFLLKQTPDVVAGLARRKGKRCVIGFCLETQDWLENARKKLRRKNLDGIVANFYHSGHVPFGRRRITTAFIDSEGRTKILRNKSKDQIATGLLDWIRSLDKKVI